MAILFGCLVTWAAAAEPFPLHPGASWTYRLEGNIASEKEGEAKQTLRGEWVMEVLEVRSVKLHQLLLVKGSIFAVPTPFEWEGRVPTPALNLMVLAPDGLLHLIEVPEARKVWDGDPKAILAKVTRETAVLRWPCKPGDSWANQGGRKRKDSLYCWNAEGWFPAPEIVQGWVARPDQKALAVSYKSGPDNQNFAFVPGLGITRFDSSHHGDAAEFSAELVQVRGLTKPVR